MTGKSEHQTNARRVRWLRVAASLYLGVGWSLALAQTPADDFKKILPAIQFLLLSGEDQRGVYNVFADHMNTPRLITDQFGQAVWRYDNSDPFGGNAPDENPSGLGTFEYPLRDAGTYSDKETGLVYNWHRYRDLPSGRFIQADPLGFAAGDLSLYVLRRNNPLAYTDSDGGQAVPFPGSGAGGLGALGGFSRPNPIFSKPKPSDNLLSEPLNTGRSMSGSSSQQCPPDEECEKKWEEDRARCVAIAGPRYGPRGVGVCQRSAFERYSECLRNGGVRGIKTPLHGVDTML